jgi:methylated-DNA-[protein]-cysteine S-methyltransferase
MSTNPETLIETLRLLREPAAATHIERFLDGVSIGDGYGRADGPLGVTWVAFNDHGVSFVFATSDESEFRARHADRIPRRLRRADLPAEVERGVATSEASALTVDLRHTPPFQRAVLEATRHVPMGETRPYGWVAARIGSPKAVRAVGTALGTNPIPLIIPCHRIVKADGSYGQYLFGVDAKVQLLELELERYGERRLRT